MKSRISLLLSVLLILSLSTCAFARTPASMRNQANKDSAKNFSVLSQQTYCSISSSQVVTPTDITSTNTYTIAYCPSTITPPVKIRVQNLDANKIYYAEYESTTGGIVAPTATCSYLVNPGEAYIGTYVPALDYGEAVEFIFYDTPSISFGGGGSAATFTIEAWTYEDAPYQD